MLIVNNIEVVYSNIVQVLKGVSLEIGDQSMVGLLGANGAGKSTTLKAISGLLKTELGKVTRGNIQFDGMRIERKGPEDIVRLGIVQVIEGRIPFDQLTVEENLRTGASTRKDTSDVKRDLEIIYNYFPTLKPLRHQRSGFLSGGELQMLVVGRGLMARPKLMLIDEPSLGLAPVLVIELFSIMRRINEDEGNSFLIVEQNARSALSSVDYGYVMEGGRIVLDGPAEKLRDNEDIKEFYLGLTAVGQKKSYRDVKHYKRRKRWLS
jgi:branched-chain amino acid transport system ATP-binding protein